MGSPLRDDAFVVYGRNGSRTIPLTPHTFALFMLLGVPRWPDLARVRGRWRSIADTLDVPLTLDAAVRHIAQVRAGDGDAHDDEELIF